ncbi:MAG: hypothetical protein M5U25_12390 [Planctomycetota bacterium]|nr:hypothetical protein [Planctomycetota bacterium]
MHVRILLLILLLAPCALWAGSGHPVWCEVTINLQKDGKAGVEYAVKYEHDSGEFHGFYFTGPQIDDLDPVWDDAWGLATLDNGRTMPIERGFNSGKKTIQFANGAGISRGSAIFKFRFATDFGRTGHLAQTTDPDGRKLVVFHWAPSEWDHALEHYTVYVRYPIEVSGDPRSPAFLDSVHFRTEKWMNEQYRIDYRNQNGRFEVLLHKDRMPAFGKMLVQQYVDAAVFEATFGAYDPSRPPVGGGPGSSPYDYGPNYLEDGSARLLLIGIVVVLLLLFAGITYYKHRETRKARDSLDDVAWEAVEWVPPKIKLSTFRKPGKVCETLTPVEVAFSSSCPTSAS